MFRTFFLPLNTDILKKNNNIKFILFEFYMYFTNKRKDTKKDTKKRRCC